jgi:DNA invertase Pin-like site-specific DNA recombinase
MLVGYMRTSAADERQSVDLQRDALIAAGVDERHLYQDKASGARDDRPGLKACLEFLHSGDVLVVWKIDRLGRSLSHMIRIVEEIKTRGVAFRSLTEQMDTTTPHGEFLFNIFGSLAQYERALIKERVMAGLAAARRHGRKGGRPPARARSGEGRADHRRTRGRHQQGVRVPDLQGPPLDIDRYAEPRRVGRHWSRRS